MKKKIVSQDSSRVNLKGKLKGKEIFVLILVFIVAGLIVGAFVDDVPLASMVMFVIFLVYATFLPLIKESIIDEDSTRMKYIMKSIFSELPLWISVLYTLSSIIKELPPAPLGGLWIYLFVITLLITNIAIPIGLKWSSLPK